MNAKESYTLESLEPRPSSLTSPLLSWRLTNRQNPRIITRLQRRQRNTVRRPPRAHQVLLHTRRRIPRRRTRHRLRNQLIRVVSTALQTSPLPVSRAAQVHVFVPGLRPHMYVCDVDVRTRLAIRTHDFHRPALRPVGLYAAPVCSCDVAECHAAACQRRHGGPVLVDVEPIRIFVTDEVLKHYIFDVAATTVGFDHHHLVRLPGVYVLVQDFGDGGIDAEGAHATAARDVAVDVFDEEVGGGRFDGDALVFVGHGDLLGVSDSLEVFFLFEY